MFEFALEHYYIYIYIYMTLHANNNKYCLVVPEIVVVELDEYAGDGGGVCGL